MWKDVNDPHVWTWPIIWSMPPQSPELLSPNESKCGRTLLDACGISIFLFFFTMEHWFLLVLNFHCVGGRVSWWPEISRSSLDGVSEKTTDFLRNRDTLRRACFLSFPFPCLRCGHGAWRCKRRVQLKPEDAERESTEDWVPEGCLAQIQPRLLPLLVTGNFIVSKPYLETGINCMQPNAILTNNIPLNNYFQSVHVNYATIWISLDNLQNSLFLKRACNHLQPKEIRWYSGESSFCTFLSTLFF